MANVRGSFCLLDVFPCVRARAYEVGVLRILSFVCFTLPAVIIAALFVRSGKRKCGSRCRHLWVARRGGIDGKVLQQRYPASVQHVNHVSVDPLRMKLKYLDLFLRWDCGSDLLQMGLFPNAKEVTESMACVTAIDKILALRFSDAATLCIVVGDGSLPRTAALIAMKTKWRRVLSIDPDLAGLPVASCQGVPRVAAKNKVWANNHSQRLEHHAAFDARRAKMHSRLVRIGEIRRLELVPRLVQDVVVDLEDGSESQVVLVLPHAHVVPEVALSRLRLGGQLLSQGNLPTVSVIQLPCCTFVRCNRIWGQAPDAEYTDECICSDDRMTPRTVRVWKNVTPAGIACKWRDRGAFNNSE
ncbi:unnamed protein product [Prorocentrum cordatum]|uniref:Uncharacterized protein n=1 Tax=Prorocentrum cordatum TaxID=2364126 RepID=A0ABN9T077_9DINO|nr:unnamed protein product [Polarella glacialis]|mmetsp:Transcript_62036/g.165857  ORF Transcript_62036/g.165857 Transcript_62036/m.165857 type:complete len:357 (+) Transcript_62036:54-1124(+)